MHWKILLRVQCVGEFFAQLLYWIVTSSERRKILSTTQLSRIQCVIQLEKKWFFPDTFSRKLLACHAYWTLHFKWRNVSFADYIFCIQNSIHTMRKIWIHGRSLINTSKMKYIQNWTNERKVILMNDSKTTRSWNIYRKFSRRTGNVQKTTVIQTPSDPINAVIVAFLFFRFFASIFVQQSITNTIWTVVLTGSKYNLFRWWLTLFKNI